MQGILQIFSATYLARLPVQAHPGHGNMMAPQTAWRVVELLVQLI